MTREDASSLASPALRRAVVMLVVLALGLGVFAGYRFAAMSETDVIEAAAARYLAAFPDGREEHCAAAPGVPPVWITVVCAPPGEPARAIYQSDRFGRITSIAPADASEAAA